MSLALEIVLKYKSFACAGSAIQALISGHASFQNLEVGVYCESLLMPINEAITLIEQQSSPSAYLCNKNGKINYADILTYHFSRIDVIGLIANESEAELWLQGLLFDNRFIQARLFETEYDFWQNAHEPAQYQCAGRSLEGLLVKPNGLPSTPEQFVIDTSQNPGRYSLKRGYIESVGSPMWLSRQFFEMTNANPEKLNNFDWLEVSNINKRVIKIRNRDGIFISDRGVQAIHQNTLRKALFEA
ncbi:MAG TPA: hypothetical protein DCO68_10370 [Methylophilaceae bacterium]|nr:hypothetical protein [Methylophilaceae bacterium]HAJ72469.1 hypothetical protein [Methylophilaceae bacterium]